MAMTLNRGNIAGMLRLLGTTGAHLSRATTKRMSDVLENFIPIKPVMAVIRLVAYQPRLTGLSVQQSVGGLVPALTRFQSSPASYVPPTSLSRPPWPELPVFDPEEEGRKHQVVVEKVKGLIEKGEYGRLFAVVHFAARQWKVTNEDLILIENHIDAACGDRIRMEKVLLVGGSDFTLIGKPLLSCDLVQVHATVIEKTESWPMVHMRFWKRHRFQKKRIIIQPQTVLRINTIDVLPRLF